MASVALLGLPSLRLQAAGVSWIERRPPPCERAEQAASALRKASERFRLLPEGGGEDAETRSLLTEAWQACPADAEVLDQVGEGLRALREPHTALALYAQAARRGLWHHPLQRVIVDFNPRLRSASLLEGDAYQELPELESILNTMQRNFPELRAEFLKARSRARSGYVNLQDCQTGNRCWQSFPPRWREGSWSHYYVAPVSPPEAFSEWFWDGDWRTCNWENYKQLCMLLMHFRQEGHEVTQVGITEVRGPRTHIPAHRSQQWRLRLVCPLVVRGNSTSSLRFPGFGEKIFKEGECFWFDESYEHEMFYRGASYRSALFMDIRHPGLDGRAARGHWAETWWNHSLAELPPTKQLTSTAQATFVDLGPGCCRQFTSNVLFGNYLGDLHACQQKCLEFSTCTHILHGWDSSRWCQVISASGSDCLPLAAGPTDCGSSGNTGVHTYQRVLSPAELSMAPQGDSPVATAHHMVGRRECWRGHRPSECCLSTDQGYKPCWAGTEDGFFGACCGTPVGQGTAIPRCSPAPAVQQEEAVCTKDAYWPSPLEEAFRSSVGEWTTNSTQMCLLLPRSVRRAWHRQIRGCDPFSRQIFSTLCRRGEPPQLLEPLAGLLRDPRVPCEVPAKGKFPKAFLMYVDWLLLADRRMLPSQTSTASRRIFFDAGGSRFPEALQFLVAEYESRGVLFDEIFVWEVKRQGHEMYWAGTPDDLRKVYEPRLTLFDGVPVTAEVAAQHNPITQILERCSAEDFCVFKLDIDRPGMERQLAAQVLEETERLGRPLVQEFIFEHHVRGPMEDFGWSWTFFKAGETPSETYADSYAMFTAMREAGIRAHSWI